MTLNDLLKRVKKEDYDKVIIFRDLNGGWCNINLKIEQCNLTLEPDTKLIFTSDK